jgi:hypothetical protein
MLRFNWVLSVQVKGREIFIKEDWTLVILKRVITVRLLPERAALPLGNALHAG